MKEIADGPYGVKFGDKDKDKKQQVLNALSAYKSEKDFQDAADLVYKIISQIISRDSAFKGTIIFSLLYIYNTIQLIILLLGGKNLKPKYDKKTIKAAAADWLSILELMTSLCLFY